MLEQSQIGNELSGGGDYNTKKTNYYLNGGDFDIKSSYIYSNSGGGKEILERFDFSIDEWKKITDEGNFIHSKDLCDIIRSPRNNVSANIDIETSVEIDGVPMALINYITELTSMLESIDESNIELLLQKADGYFKKI